MQRLLNAETYEFEDHVLNDDDTMSDSEEDADDIGFDEAEFFDTVEVMSLEDQYRMYY